MGLRLILLALVGGGAWLLVSLWQRRPVGGDVGLPAGVTLVTGPGCSLCEPAERALRQAGVEPRLAEVGAPDLPDAPIRSLPTALLVNHAGTVVMRRSGRAAVADAGVLAARWREISAEGGRPGR
ncbi:MAG: hypothetical protein ACR2OI_02800 [Acidimicrobiia bacterium]